MPAATTLIDQLSDAWPPHRWAGVGVVVGCSGGADSVGLLRVMAEIGASLPQSGFLVAAHFNHALRGEASDGDEHFVEALARSLGVRFVGGRALKTKSDEASLRSARLEFLVDTAKSLGCRYITLAHSADDNVETVLHHLMRGTGPSGLAGIAPHRPVDDDLVIVRPLIGVRRQSIRDYLVKVGQSWREDASNAETVYQRNWLRNELIPLIESRYADATEAIGRAAMAQRDWRDLIDSAGADWVQAQAVADGKVLVWRDSETPSAVVIAGLQTIWDRLGWPRGEMTRDHWLRLAATIADQDPSTNEQRYTLPGKIDVRASGKSIRFAVCNT
ncbi:tRNA lysidine(34) synthetase TilS [Rubripirellula reticaptiva]|nr:tRNA lysidine(34) synthetase TilS [Rubripirellula reticaptiva]